jgi:hypothetical protein
MNTQHREPWEILALFGALTAGYLTFVGLVAVMEYIRLISEYAINIIV